MSLLAEPMVRKGRQQDEAEPTQDEIAMAEKFEKAAKAMLTPGRPHTATGAITASTTEGEQPSVWAQWVASQQRSATQRGIDTNDCRSMKARVASARRHQGQPSSRSTSTKLDSNRFNSTLATASGFTHTGVKATRARIAELKAAAEKEAEEVAELQEILGRTLYTGGGNYFKRAGDVATSTLQKLDDGQNDNVVTLRNRLIAEEEMAAVHTGRPKWDGTAFKDIPPSLKGCKPITPEPWARDQQVYEDGMSGHGFKSIDTGVGAMAGYKKGKHVSIIESDIIAYRREMGSEKKAPVSARMLRAHGLEVPQNSQRGSARPTSAKGKIAVASSPAEAERAARIASKSPPKDAKKK